MSFYYAAIKLLTPEIVTHELAKVKEWKKLARHLGLDSHQILKIQRECRQLKEIYIREVVKIWFEVVSPTWEKLVEALDRCCEQKIAANIRQKYLN